MGLIYLLLAIGAMAAIFDNKEDNSSNKTDNNKEDKDEI